MADIALGSVGKIIDIGLKINEAVKNVKQNEKECRDIERCVGRVTRIIDCFNQTVKRFDEVSPATEAIHKDNSMSMHDALEDLAESLEGALELVTKCQQKHVIRRLIGARDMAKQLRLVRNDILSKVTIGSFASISLQLGITLMTIAQAAPAPKRHQQGVGTEKPSHGGHLIIGDARFETDQTNKLATGSGAQSVPFSGLTKFNLSELEVATQNFLEEIGTGSSAAVFKGLLRNGLVVAVKKFKAWVHLESAMVEMNIGVKLQHKNVVKTLGYCDHKQVKSVEHEGRVIEATIVERILVTAYLPNRSLHDMVQSGTQRIYWPFYFRIIQEITQGLHYIHEQNVVHGDLKPHNILFDSDMNPVITDFGLSVVLDNGVDIMTTDQTRGTWGYMAPEYVRMGIVSKKYDVFSFGVILIRTIPRAFLKVECQDKGYQNLDSSWDAVLEEGVDKMKEFFDLTRVEETELTEVARCLKVGLLCREFDPADRPTMSEVLDMLNGQKEVLVPARKKKPIDSSSGEE